VPRVTCKVCGNSRVVGWCEVIFSLFHVFSVIIIRCPVCQQPRVHTIELFTPD